MDDLLLFIVTIYLSFNVLYLFVSAIAGRFKKPDDSPVTNGILRRIAVLIPAYKEDGVILNSVVANLQQTYPREFYDLIVIADSFQPETLDQLAQYPVKIMTVQFAESTVQKSITHALNSLPENSYDIVVISDADNHMAPDFLLRINQAFTDGWRAIQGHRVAKNTNTSVAIFDAMNEEVNNNIFRAGQRVLGLSATLIGSGMGFELPAMKWAMNQTKTVGGYDKEIEMLLLSRGIKIGYLHKAFIFDEKVQNLSVFEKQRMRWIAAQVYFIRTYFQMGVRELFLGNIQAFNALVKSLLLPRTLLLVALLLMIVTQVVTANHAILSFSVGMLAVLTISLSLSIPLYLWRKLSIRDVFIFPLLVLSMIRSLINYRKAGKKFIHTPHGEAVEQPNAKTSYEVS
ncbi:glycosyltransferase [Spirosoma spitsbergense]|uniref:glycosyltransferase n=1 Tax=Spirosoma spitsbergense TaxID=431554 RepID=UPI00037CDD2E|nr:glycosyltransferase family 2 protein [Spirosoma spitsbergense]